MTLTITHLDLILGQLNLSMRNAIAVSENLLQSMMDFAVKQQQVRLPLPLAVPLYRAPLLAPTAGCKDRPVLSIVRIAVLIALGELQDLVITAKIYPFRNWYLKNLPCREIHG